MNIYTHAHTYSSLVFRLLACWLAESLVRWDVHHQKHNAKNYMPEQIAREKRTPQRAHEMKTIFE